MDKIRLENIDKKTPFSVPDEFFAELTKDIQARIIEKPKRRWMPAPQMNWVLAGTFAFVIGLIFIFKPSAQLSAEELLAQVNEQDLMNYLDMTDFTEAELLGGLSDAEIDELWLDDELLEGLEIDEENLDEFLIDFETDLDKYL